MLVKCPWGQEVDPMRQVMCVGVLAMMLGTGVAAEGRAVEVGVPESRSPALPYEEHVQALVTAAENGDVEGVIAAARDLADDAGVQPAGSVCVRGVPSKPALELGLPGLNANLQGVLEVPAGPSSHGGGEGGNALWIRILEVAYGLGNCSAGGISYVAFTDFEVKASDGESWGEWLSQ